MYNKEGFFPTEKNIRNGHKKNITSSEIENAIFIYETDLRSDPHKQGLVLLFF